MSSNISNKDKKDWENFLSNDEKLPNKDSKLSIKKSTTIKSFDFHGFSLDEANNKIRVSVQYSGNADDNVTNAQFADTLCWYHVVIRLDSTQGTAANRCLIWVNGQQQSMSSNAGSPSGNITAFQTSLSNQHYWGGIYN